MNDLRLAGHLALVDGVDDDAWVVFTAVKYKLPAERVADVLAGRCDTGTLPEAAAVAVLGRIDDPAVAEHLALCDERDAVRAAVAQVHERSRSRVQERRDDLVRALAAAAEGLRANSAAAHEAVAEALVNSQVSRTLEASVIAETVVAVLGGQIPGTGLELDTVQGRFRLAAGVLRKLSADLDGRTTIAALVALLDDADPSVATAVHAVFAAHRSVPRPDELNPVHFCAASAAFAALGDTEVRCGGGVTAARNIAFDAVRCALAAGGTLFGPAGVADALGWAPEGGPDQHAASVIITAARDARRPELIDELVDAATASGARVAPIAGLTPAMCSAAVSPAALICALPAPDTPEKLNTLIHQLCERAQHTDATELTEKLHARPELADPVLEMLPRALPRSEYPSIPVPLREASQRHSGLHPWIAKFDEVRAELVAAGAGIGQSRWVTIAQLLEGFRGTPVELVEVSAAVAPTTTPLQRAN